MLADLGRAAMALDIYKAVTDRIIELLDQDTVPWRHPIRGGGGEKPFPTNLASERAYRGINVFLLAVTGWAEGYESPYWLTFVQAKNKGGHVRKGEKGSLVILWKQYATQDKETGDDITVPVLRHYTVFNAEQCEGIEVPPPATVEGDAVLSGRKAFNRFADLLVTMLCLLPLLRGRCLPRPSPAIHIDIHMCFGVWMLLLGPQDRESTVLRHFREPGSQRSLVGIEEVDLVHESDQSHLPSILPNGRITPPEESPNFWTILRDEGPQSLLVAASNAEGEVVVRLRRGIFIHYIPSSRNQNMSRRHYAGRLRAPLPPKSESVRDPRSAS